MTAPDRQALRELAEHGEERGIDALLHAVDRRLARRRGVRLAVVPVLLLATVTAGRLAFDALASPTGVEVAATGAPQDPCPEGETSMRRTRIVAVIGVTTLVGCTDGGAPGTLPSPSPAVGSAPMHVALRGDLQGSASMTVDPVDWTARSSDEAALEDWAAGTLELPRTRFTSEDHAVTMSWPDWDQHHDPSRVALTFRFDGHLTSPDPGECVIALETAEPFVLRGTIDCEGLEGVKPGADQTPVYDVHATVDVGLLVCVEEEDEEQGTSSCRPVEVATTGATP